MQWDAIHGGPLTGEWGEEGTSSNSLQDDCFVTIHDTGKDIVYYIKTGSPLTADQKQSLMLISGLGAVMRWNRNALLLDLFNTYQIGTFKIDSKDRKKVKYKGEGLLYYNNNSVTKLQVSNEFSIPNVVDVEITLKVLISYSSGKKTYINVGTLHVINPDYQIKVSRTDYPDKYYLNTQKIGESMNGEAELRQNEILTLELESNISGNMAIVNNTEWRDNNNNNILDQISTYNHTINNLETIRIIDLDTGKELLISLNLYEEPVIPTATSTNIAHVDVSDLTGKINQNKIDKQKNIYNTAILSVRSTSAAMYSDITNSTNIECYIKHSMTDVALTTLTRSKKVHFPLLSIGNIDFEDGTNVEKYTDLGNAHKSKTIMDADLITGLLPDEKQNILDANTASQNGLNGVNLLRQDILTKLRNFNPDQETDLIREVTAGTVGTITDSFINSLYYELPLNDLDYIRGYYLEVTKDVTVGFNYSKYRKDQNMFEGLMAHEFKHIHYGRSDNYFISWLLWYVIREKSISESVYLLKDAPNDNLNSGDRCSGGGGHERNNPQNCDVCNEGRLYDTNHGQP